MNYLYYSLDDGSRAHEFASNLIEGEPSVFFTDMTPGKISQIGQALGNNIYVCGVGESEAICRMAWAHALHQNGKTVSEWNFIKVQ